MKIETLKALIIREINLLVDEDELVEAISDILDLYEKDNETSTYPDWSKPTAPYKNPYVLEIKTQTYGDICPCNPKNGGSGICGCTIGNQIVGQPVYYWTTTTTTNAQIETSRNS